MRFFIILLLLITSACTVQGQSGTITYCSVDSVCNSFECSDLSGAGCEINIKEEYVSRPIKKTTGVINEDYLKKLMQLFRNKIKAMVTSRPSGGYTFEIRSVATGKLLYSRVLQSVSNSNFKSNAPAKVSNLNSGMISRANRKPVDRNLRKLVSSVFSSIAVKVTLK